MIRSQAAIGAGAGAGACSVSDVMVFDWTAGESCVGNQLAVAGDVEDSLLGNGNVVMGV